MSPHPEAEVLREAPIIINDHPVLRYKANEDTLGQLAEYASSIDAYEDRADEHARLVKGIEAHVQNQTDPPSMTEIISITIDAMLDREKRIENVKRKTGT